MAGHGVWASGVVQGSGEEGCFHAGGRRRAKERERERQREEAAGARPPGREGSWTLSADMRERRCGAPSDGLRRALRMRAA